VQKADPPDELVRALKSARAGERFLSSGIAVRTEMTAPGTVALSPRQETILRYLAQGENNKEISYKPGLATPTISFYLGEIRRKLGAKNNRQIVDAARSASLID